MLQALPFNKGFRMFSLSFSPTLWDDYFLVQVKEIVSYLPVKSLSWLG